MPFLPPGYTLVNGKPTPPKPAPKAPKGPLAPWHTNPAFIPSAIYGPGKTVMAKSGEPIGNVNIKQVQKNLRNAGYDINIDGKMGPLTKSALADYLRPNTKNPTGRALATMLRGTIITGNRNPKKWSARFGLSRKTKMVERPLTGKGGQLNRFGNDPGGGGSLAGYGPSPTLPSGGGVPTMIPMDPSMADQGLSYLPTSMADSQAGLQYDPQIHQTQIDQMRLPVQNAQDEHDIGNWYGQAIAAQQAAAARDAEAGRAGTQATQDATQAIIGSLGGAANPGSASVGAAGADAVGTIAAMGVAQNQYNNDLTPLLTQEKASQLLGQRNKGNTALQDIVNQLATLQGQRGQAKSAALMDITKYNQDLKNTAYERAQQIKQYNDQLKQQTFQNKQAIESQNIAGILAGAKLSKVANKQAKGSFGQLSALDRAGVRNSLVTDIQGQIKNGVSTPQVVSRLGTIIRSQGWSFTNPSVKQFAFNVLQLAGIRPDPKWFK